MMIDDEGENLDHTLLPAVAYSGVVDEVGACNSPPLISKIKK